MKRFTTIAVLVVALSGSVTPAASAAVPTACLGLVTQLADGVGKVIGSLTSLPPEPVNAFIPAVDSLGVLNALQAAKCLPSLPATPTRDADTCLTAVLGLYSSLYGLLAKLTSSPSDVLALVAHLAVLVKLLGGTVANCGLPLPAGGLPLVPGLPGTSGLPGIPIPGIPPD